MKKAEITEKSRDDIYGNMLCNAVYSGNEQLVHYLVEEGNERCGKTEQRIKSVV